MAECLIRKNSGAIDTEGLTATPNDVALGETFYGYGTDDPQTGTIVNHGTKTPKIEINGSHTFPAGIYEDGTYAYQEVPTQEGLNIMPVSTGSIAGISGKYMTGNTIIKGIENLIPANIKAGVTIGDLSGTWQGYVNTSHLTPYWYGIFYPGQSGSMARAQRYDWSGSLDWHNTHPNMRHQRIAIEGIYPPAGVYPAIRFNAPIALEGVTKVTIGYELNDNSASDYTRLILGENLVYEITDTLAWTINSAMGYNEYFKIPANNVSAGSYGTATFTIANAARLHYVYFTIGVMVSSAISPFMGIHFVKFE